MVIATAKRAQIVDQTCIATDSTTILKLAKQYKIPCVLTNSNHSCGTDRVNEAANLLNLDDNELIIGLQADEPFIEPEILQQILQYLATIDRDFKMLSAYDMIDKAQAQDPNVVKVVCDENHDAIYFSRSLIPYDREDQHNNYYKHIGLYAYDRKTLAKFCNFKPSQLEQTEKLEQLRAIANGEKIAMIRLQTQSFGIDTQADYERALALLQTQQ